MHYARNIFSLVIIIFVGSILLLNSEWSSERARILIEQEIKRVSGYEVEIGRLKFDLPRSVVLSDLSIQNSPYGSLKVEKATFTAPLLKLIFGSLQGGDLALEGIWAEDPALACLPGEVCGRLSWDANQEHFQAEFDRLSSINSLVPYKLLGKAEFKAELAATSADGEILPVFRCMVDKLQIKEYQLSNLCIQSLWDPKLQEGHFSIHADQAQSDEAIFGEVLASVKGISGEGIWSFESGGGRFSLSFDELNAQKAQAKQAGDSQDYMSLWGLDFLPLEVSDGLQASELKEDCAAVLIKDVVCVGEWDPRREHANLSFSVKQVGNEHFSLSDSTLKLTSDDPARFWKYELRAYGVYEDELQAELKGSLQINEDGAALNLDALSGLFAEHRLSLNRSCRIMVENDLSFTLPQFSFSVDDAEAHLSGHADLKTIDMKLSLPKQSFNEVALGPDIPLLTGELSAEMVVQGPFSDLQGSVEVFVESLAVGKPSLDNPSLFSLRVDADLSSGVIVLGGTLSDRGERLLEINGRCPVEQVGLFCLEPSKDKGMAIHLFGKMDLARYVHSLLPQAIWVTGQTAVDIHLTGPFHSPELEGYVKLLDGTFESWETGTILSNIHADLELTHEKIILHSIKASDSQGGVVSALGELDLISALDYPFHVDFSVENGMVVDLDELRLILSGAISFVGNAKGAEVKGELSADRLDITLTEDSAAIDHNIEVVYVNQSDDEAAPTIPSKSSVEWPVCFDLHIKNKGNILIHSKELTSEWKGDIKIAGCNTQPLMYGDFRAINGVFVLPDYLFPGKKFKISQGTISFNGEFSKKTTLYVVGEMEIEHIVAQVVLKGPLSDPSLQFRSNPPLSQREILSWILFGRGMGDITPFEGAELTQSLNQLKRAGAGGGPNPSILNGLARLKESLGIDRIGIDRTNTKDGNEEISLQVGKYIMPDVFLGIRRNMSSDVNRIGVEANLMRNLKIQAELGDDTDGQLHLKWKHDY